MKKTIEKPSDKRLYTQKLNWFREQQFEEVEPMNFYRELFPVGSFEEKGNKSGKPNGILVEIVEDRGLQTIVTDELDGIKERLGKENVIMSPISYYGKRR